MTDSTPQNKALHPEVIAYLKQQDDIMRSVIVPEAETQRHKAALDIVMESYLSLLQHFDDDEVGDYAGEIHTALVVWADELGAVIDKRTKVEYTVENADEEYLEEPEENKTDQ